MTNEQTTEKTGDSARVMEKFSPVTGESLGEFRMATASDVQQAVGRARAAQPAWAKLTVAERFVYLRRLKAVISERGEEYARSISSDTGKPLVDSLMTELMSIPFYVDYYDSVAPKILARKKIRTPLIFFPSQSYVEHHPMGVIAVISPWNFPFQLAVVPVISALIAGNTVVLKPSEVTPLTAGVISDVFARLGLPPGVVEIVLGDGSAGAALTRADVDKIFFTGSVATGKKVMAAAAEKPIPVELELGGKDAMIVCADAPLERAARAAAWGALLNAGQMCISVERILVVDAVHDEFVALLEREVKRVKVGGPDENADMGPITFPPQLQTIERHVNAAVAAGARLLTGGRRLERKGMFYPPTLLTNVSPEMEIYREESFGPVIPVTRVKDEDEAVRLANDHQYGLTASVWTRDTARGLELASRVVAGQVNVNDVVISVGNFRLPFGGVKASGFGRYHGPEGLFAFTNQKSIMVSRNGGNAEANWFPYAGKYPDMKIIFDALLAGNLPRALLAKARLSKLHKPAEKA